MVISNKNALTFNKLKASQSETHAVIYDFLANTRANVMRYFILLICNTIHCYGMTLVIFQKLD